MITCGQLLSTVLRCGVLLLVMGTASLGKAADSEPKLLSIDKVSAEARPIALAGKTVNLETPTSSSQAVKVGLSMEAYRCRIHEGTGDKAQERELHFLCYALTAEDKATTYTRAVLTFDPVGGFRLFNSARGKNYLAWVGGQNVYIEEVSKPKGVSEALSDLLSKEDHLAGPARYRLPVGALVGTKQFEGRHATYADIDIVSVDDDESGTLRVVVQAPKTGERFEFAFDGKAWAQRATTATQ